MQKNQKADDPATTAAPAPTDDVFKIDPVADSTAELSDDELDGVAGGAMCGAGTCVGKKRTANKT